MKKAISGRKTLAVLALLVMAAAMLPSAFSESVNGSNTPPFNYSQNSLNGISNSQASGSASTASPPSSSTTQPSTSTTTPSQPSTTTATSTTFCSPSISSVQFDGSTLNLGEQVKVTVDLGQCNASKLFLAVTTYEIQNFGIYWSVFGWPGTKFDNITEAFKSISASRKVNEEFTYLYFKKFTVDAVSKEGQLSGSQVFEFAFSDSVLDPPFKAKRDWYKSIAAELTQNVPGINQSNEESIPDVGFLQSARDAELFKHQPAKIYFTAIAKDTADNGVWKFSANQQVNYEDKTATSAPPTTNPPATNPPAANPPTTTPSTVPVNGSNTPPFSPPTTPATPSTPSTVPVNGSNTPPFSPPTTPSTPSTPGTPATPPTTAPPVEQLAGCDPCQSVVGCLACLDKALAEQTLK
ncbi:MAG: hypothetical protein V1493_06765 [Candidatus Diapherotrites archaeon]